MDVLLQMPKVIFMVCGVCTIGIIVGWFAAQVMGKKVADFLTFLPTERFATAPPAMGIPASKAMSGDLHGAVDSYEELLLKYPHDKEIYFRLLEVVLGPLKMEAYGENVLQRGFANLEKEADRKNLRDLCDAIRSGDYHPLQHLEPRPLLEVKILPPLFRRVES
ncbi:MAG: hypothetical protein EOP88_07865 [Verrucomicrobiaceae bacterium]|nr:MAG: hypothetical protein EOP88_07865 [Verrucomicrobiaceae bacterium]